MIKKPKIGIMQGRLSKQQGDKIQTFPISSWEQEFEQASKYGFEVIQWLFDDLKNPIFQNEEISNIISIIKKYDIKVNSVCADYFMSQKLFSESEDNISKNLQVLAKLIRQCHKLDISMIEIPLVDSSSMKTADEKSEFKNNLEKFVPLIEELGVALGLETDLPPQDFRDLLLEINHPQILANYDSGNSASLGYDPIEELHMLKDWIKNIHIKDRKLHGITVPFGTGDTNFDHFFSTLTGINYFGDLIIQGARNKQKNISPTQTCIEYQRFVDKYVNKYYTPSVSLR